MRGAQGSVPLQRCRIGTCIGPEREDPSARRGTVSVTNGPPFCPGSSGRLPSGGLAAQRTLYPGPPCGAWPWRCRKPGIGLTARPKRQSYSACRLAARNLDLPADAVFHSDRGSNYTSAEFAAALGRLGIRQSVGRTVICFDNALAESFNAALKVERVHRTAYPTRKKAREDIARYIEIRYNRLRLHSALGYRTPQEAHDEYLNLQAAA